MRLAIGHRIGALAIMVLLASGGTASAKLTDLAIGTDEAKAASKCVATIQKEGAKYAAAHMKLIIKCKSGVIKGKGGTLGGCNPLVGDLATKDAGNAGKLASKIEGKCGGKDKTCGGGVGDNADIPLANISWDVPGGACPVLEGNDPSITISDCSDIAPCIVAQAQFANHQIANDIGADLMDSGIFGAGSDPGKTDNKCQQTIFKELTKFALAKAKILGKCWTSKTKLKGDDFSDGDPCPETDVVKAKTKAGIEKVEQKFAAAVCKKCGAVGDKTKDGRCDDGAGGDTGGAPISGFITGPFACPAVTVPPCTGPGCPVHHYDVGGDPSDGVDCGSIGGGTVDTVQEYIDCLTCVAEYKTDCMGHLGNGDDPGLGMVYPTECSNSLCGNGVVDAGETCDTAAASPQCPGGNGTQDCGTDCQCHCPSAVTFEPDPNDPASTLSTGFTGNAHGSKVIGLGAVTVALTGGDQGVPGLRDPTCGVMNIAGPLQNPAAGAGQIDVLRCSIDSSRSCIVDINCPGICTGTALVVTCAADSDCAASQTCTEQTCETYFGSRLPLSAGGVSACVTNRFVGPIIGTADIETGDSAIAVGITSEVVVGPTVDKPCDNCIGDLVANDGSRDGTCDSGGRMGEACDVGGVSPVPAFNGGVPSGGMINGTSLDCPQGPPGANAGVLPINLSSSTGTESLTVQATGPTCTAAGFGGSTCMCDTCATLAAEPCNSDADCPATVTCGGLRCLGGTSAGNPCASPGIGDPACSAHCTGAGTPEPCCTAAGMGTCAACGGVGEPTKPNACISGTCTAGACAGTFNGFCGPTETFRGCLLPSDCPFPGDSCGFIMQPCFDDNGVVGSIIATTGLADPPVNDLSNPTLASTFCVPPVAAAAINTATGLPGAGVLTLRGAAVGFDGPFQCSADASVGAGPVPRGTDQDCLDDCLDELIPKADEDFVDCVVPGTVTGSALGICLTGCLALAGPAVGPCAAGCVGGAAVGVATTAAACFAKWTIDRCSISFGCWWNC